MTLFWAMIWFNKPIMAMMCSIQYLPVFCCLRGWPSGLLEDRRAGTHPI